MRAERGGIIALLGSIGLAVGAASATLVSFPARVAADDDELVLMREPATFVDVVDAFDEHDPFDLNVSIAYLRTWEQGTVQREPGAGDPDGRMSRQWEDVADYSREVNQLIFGLDVGIYRDLALYARLPLVLSDDRSLSNLAGESSIIFDRSSTPERLFELPFRSPTRSGLDWVSAGIAWSVLNQQRDRHVPTWVWMLEGRFNIDQPMRACARVGDDVRCQGGGTDPGISRGTNALRVETRGSYRYQYLEPYAGLAFQIEFPGNANELFTQRGNLAGYINQRPPILGRLTVGAQITPWEDRQHWQRFAIDLRFTGDYVSEGLEYSPLFDALGSSTNRFLSTPNCEGVSPCSGLEEVDFNGLTTTQAHARIGGQLTLEMQAARYVKFSVGAAFFHSPSYVLTQTDACNPNADVADDDPRIGSCRQGIINPHHRPAIDLPGQRFRMESLTQVDLMASVTAQF